MKIEQFCSETGAVIGKSKNCFTTTTQCFTLDFTALNRVFSFLSSNGIKLEGISCVVSMSYDYLQVPVNDKIKISIGKKRSKVKVPVFAKIG